jgi:hypothetical protein
MASTISASPASATGVIRKSADSSGVLVLQTNTTDALTISTAQNVTLNAVGALAVPSGTTAQRPASPTNGMLRYNTTIPQLEIYINGWTTVQ